MLCITNSKGLNINDSYYMLTKAVLLAEGWSRDRIVNEIVAVGVPCFQGSCAEVYLEKAFDGTGFRPEKRLASAVELGETSLMFLVHPTLTQAEIDKTVSVIKQVFGLAGVWFGE
jgi:dTDP-4-amino-4,6-dideoxygalactose transaminase